MPRVHWPYRYIVYGLILASSRSIPYLVTAEPDQPVDLEIDLVRGRYGLFRLQGSRLIYQSQLLGANGESVLKVWSSKTNSAFRFLYDDGTEFMVDALSRRVTVDWPDTLSMENALTYLLGPILGFALRLHGVVCLHASAVMISGRAVALMGPAGTGKSTTAAAFARRGFPVLTDDIVTLEERDERFWVRPGYPRLNLWPQSVQAVLGPDCDLPHITPAEPYWDKRYLTLDGPASEFMNQPVPLAAIYTGEANNEALEPEVSTLAGQDALLAMLANTYSYYLLTPAMREHEFDVLSRVARSVPVRWVKFRRDLNRLDALCKTILADAGTTSA